MKAFTKCLNCDELIPFDSNRLICPKCIKKEHDSYDKYLAEAMK